MRVRIEYRGQVIGISDVEVRLPFGGGALIVTDQYAPLALTVREHARALHQHGYLPASGMTSGGHDLPSEILGEDPDDAGDRAALARGDELFNMLTVCAEDGEMLATEDVWITDLGDGNVPGAFITFADP